MTDWGRADEFATLARELAGQPGLAATLHAVVEQAVRRIEGAEDAAITIKRADQRYQTIASTGSLPIQVDEIQYATDEGPCLTALLDSRVIRTDELAADPRWPRFGPRAFEATGVVSMMSHRLFLEDDKLIGALNLYSRAAGAFDQLDPSVLDVLATHCAIALANASQRDQNEQLRAALESNREIGIAIGILMASKLVTKDQAFDQLRIASQHWHRKLRDIAQDVIESGMLPEIADRAVMGD